MTLQQFEANAFIFCGLAFVIIILVIGGVIYAKGKSMQLTAIFKNAKRHIKSCADGCKNYDGECADKNTECYYYEPKQTKATTKSFNPLTGEVTVLDNTPCGKCKYRVDNDCRNNFKGAYDEDEFAPSNCDEVKRCVFYKEKENEQ